MARVAITRDKSVERAVEAARAHPPFGEIRHLFFDGERLTFEHV